MRNGLRIARNAKGAELIKVVNRKDGRLANNQVKVPENGTGARGKANVKVKSYQKNKA